MHDFLITILGALRRSVRRRRRYQSFTDDIVGFGIVDTLRVVIPRLWRCGKILQASTYNICIITYWNQKRLLASSALNARFLDFNSGCSKKICRETPSVPIVRWGHPRIRCRWHCACCYRPVAPLAKTEILWVEKEYLWYWGLRGVAKDRPRYKRSLSKRRVEL